MVTSTTPTTPTTLLDAVNALLNAARVGPVQSLNAADINEDAGGAKTALDDVTREVLLRGYEFNTEREAVLDPNLAGEIVLPVNTLKVRSSRWQSGTRLVHRGSRLYDPKRRTFNIGTSVTVDLVVALEFQDLPPAARFYVTAVAARRFALPRLPQQATFQYTQEAVASALAQMEEEDTEAADSSLPETSPHFAAMKRR